MFGWQIDARTSWRVLDAFVDAGGNWIDTADFYAAFALGIAAVSLRPSSVDGSRDLGTATGLWSLRRLGGSLASPA